MTLLGALTVYPLLCQVVAKSTNIFAGKVLGDNSFGTTSGITIGMEFVVDDAATRNCTKGAVSNNFFAEELFSCA